MGVCAAANDVDDDDDSRGGEGEETDLGEGVAVETAAAALAAAAFCWWTAAAAAAAAAATLCKNSRWPNVGFKMLSMEKGRGPLRMGSGGEDGGEDDAAGACRNGWNRAVGECDNVDDCSCGDFGAGDADCRPGMGLSVTLISGDGGGECSLAEEGGLVGSTTSTGRLSRLIMLMATHTFNGVTFLVKCVYVVYYITWL